MTYHVRFQLTTGTVYSGPLAYVEALRLVGEFGGTIVRRIV